MKMLFYKGEAYEAHAPVADSIEIAALGDRLMFRHDNFISGEPEFFKASKGEVYSGYVIGLFLATNI